MSVVKLSAVVITYNEEENILRCIQSLKKVADEIVVADSFSTDNTKEICLSNGVSFIEHDFEGHIEQKNFAIEQALNHHVISLDADEELSDELINSVIKIKHNWQADGYQLSRLTQYCGKWIRHCGWYPDRKVRLWDRTKGRWGGENPHDLVIMEGGSKVVSLPGDILHYSFPSIQSHLDTVSKFSEIAAREAVKKNKKVQVLIHVVLNPVYTFFNKYFLNLGFMDGYYGLVICSISAFANFVKYTKIRELQKK